MSRQLAEILLKDKIISQQFFAEAEGAAKGGYGYVRHLIDRGYLSETKLLYYLSQKFGLPNINLDKFEIAPQVIQKVPAELVRRFHCIPIQSNQGTLVVAVADPANLGDLENIKFHTKMNVEAVLTSYSALDRAVSKHYGGVVNMGQAIQDYTRQVQIEKSEESGAVGGGMQSAPEIEIAEVHELDSEASADEGPVIQLVNGILGETIRHMASDVHIEPYEKRCRVRMRLDGQLREVTQIPIEMKRAVVVRVKIMARLDIAETRVPQDGRIKLKSGGTEIDFRVSTMPTLFGEKVVMRMLHKGMVQLDVNRLGFDSGQLKAFKTGIHRPNGMVLVTGPTGSGKTTTLYSALTDLNKVNDNLSTVEDPVEYNIDGINQVQVHKEVGLTFASVLRSMLRQDPDKILVGEIRDYETAEVAIQAALTGHMVLSTLHTNDAPSSVVRLMNMGVEPFLVTAAINTVVAQRLVRRICPSCKTEERVPKQKFIELGFSPDAANRLRAYRGRGCAQCGRSGYRGRIAVYEVFDFTPAIKDRILKGATATEIKAHAIQEGMKTLRMSALTKVAEGTTTLEEALAITSEN